MIRGTHVALAACLLAAAFSSAASGPSSAAGSVSISIDDPQNGTVIEEELNITGTAAGPEGIELAVSVSIDGGPPFPARGNTSWAFRWSPAIPGQHIIEATATAGNETATAQVVVSFNLPQPPAQISGHDPASTELSLTPGENLTLSVTITGSVVGAVVRWYENGSELTGESGHLRINLSMPTGLEGIIPVEARLVVNGNVTDSARWNITVALPERPPVILDFQPDKLNLSIAQQEEARFNVSASDPDGDELNITWLVDGKTRASGLNMSYFEISFNKSGDHCVTASVSDGNALANITWNLTIAEEYIPGPLDIAPCIVYIVLGLFAGIWYGMRTGRFPRQRPS